MPEDLLQNYEKLGALSQSPGLTTRTTATEIIFGRSLKHRAFLGMAFFLIGAFVPALVSMTTFSPTGSIALRYLCFFCVAAALIASVVKIARPDCVFSIDIQRQTVNVFLPLLIRKKLAKHKAEGLGADKSYEIGLASIDMFFVIWSASMHHTAGVVQSATAIYGQIYALVRGHAYPLTVLMSPYSDVEAAARILGQITNIPAVSIRPVGVSERQLSSRASRETNLPNPVIITGVGSLAADDDDNVEKMLAATAISPQELMKIGVLLNTPSARVGGVS